MRADCRGLQPLPDPVPTCAVCWLLGQVEVSYKNIKEVRTAPRAFGLWGDCVIFLKVGEAWLRQQAWAVRTHFVRRLTFNRP